MGRGRMLERGDCLMKQPKDGFVVWDAHQTMSILLNKCCTGIPGREGEFLLKGPNAMRGGQLGLTASEQKCRSLLKL
ncbi:hypothetical protein L195_g000102 [Trifolium pratense]|uniref:Uncharacterized protein n=1 Tax=Trifolium pratense TaxID=57577 RepID=A0A2K3NKY7_TRIPR|nr:hypothetical protein L195_g000102 [Trifolium pratense]